MADWAVEATLFIAGIWCLRPVGLAGHPDVFRLPRGAPAGCNDVAHLCRMHPEGQARTDRQNPAVAGGGTVGGFVSLPGFRHVLMPVSGGAFPTLARPISTGPEKEEHKFKAKQQSMGK